MPPRATFPQEIFDLLIDSRSDDLYSLSHFSLVARAWTVGARKHLFRHIVMSNENRAKAFLSLFDSNVVTFAQHIQELVFVNHDNEWHHPSISLSWKSVLRVITQLNQASAHNVRSMTLSKLTDVEASPQMRTQLLGNISSLQLHDVQFYDHHGLRQFLIHFTGLESLKITVPPSVPLVASAPIDELNILSPDVLSQLRSLNLKLAFRSPLLSWFARNKTAMCRLNQSALSLDSDVLVHHIKDFGETLTSFAPSLHSLNVQFYILPRNIRPDLFESLNLASFQNLTSVRIHTMLRENSLCVASLLFASKLPPSLQNLLFHVFIGMRDANAAEPLCTPAWNSIAEGMTRPRFPDLREFRFVLTFFTDSDAQREKTHQKEVANTIMTSFPESIWDSLHFGAVRC